MGLEQCRKCFNIGMQSDFLFFFYGHWLKLVPVFSMSAWWQHTKPDQAFPRSIFFLISLGWPYQIYLKQETCSPASLLQKKLVIFDNNLMCCYFVHIQKQQRQRRGTSWVGPLAFPHLPVSHQSSVTVSVSQLPCGGTMLGPPCSKIDPIQF